MKDYEKRQKNSKGQYKGSIHDNQKKWKKQTDWAGIALTLLFIGFLFMALAGMNGGK